MKWLYFISISVLVACNTKGKTDVLSFRTGCFKTYLDTQKDSASFCRTKNLQIEQYKNQIDSFSIYWTSNFEYELRKINPKKKLDSIPFVVKITSIKKDYYEFKGAYKGSNFKQKGITYKIKN